MRVKNMPIRSLGVLAPKGQGQWGDDQDDIIIPPYTTLQKKLLGQTYLRQVMISADRPENVEATAVDATRILRQRHRIQNPEEDDFTVRTVEEMAQTRVQLDQNMTRLLNNVDFVRLLVGL